MTSERIAHAACVVLGKIYFVGVFNQFQEVVNTIECYDPTTDSRSVIGKTDDELIYHSLITM